MKFLAFNIVVAAALGYLVWSDRESREAEGRVPTAPIDAALPAPDRGPAPLAPLAPPPPPNPAELPSGGADVPDPAAATARAPAEVGPPISPADPEPAIRAPQPEGAGPLMPAAERGRSLRDLARQMEERFLAGAR